MKEIAITFKLKVSNGAYELLEKMAKEKDKTVNVFTSMYLKERAETTAMFKEIEIKRG